VKMMSSTVLHSFPTGKL